MSPLSRTTRGVIAACDDLGVNTDGATGIRRTHAGYDQRSCGAWSWYLAGTLPGRDVGGYHAASVVIAAHRDGRVSTYSSGGGTSLCVEPRRVKTREGR